MIKQITAFAVTALFALNVTQTYAADEFGPRFWNQTQAAFGEVPENIKPNIESVNDIMANDMDAAAMALQNIMPAAGEETNKEENIIKDEE